MVHRKKYCIFTVISFCVGAILLCVFATIQKKAIGAPLGLTGYVVPLLFGGIFGGLVGRYISLIRKYNILLEERVHTLESLLPICAKCKKIRKTGTDPERQSSWVPIEHYISTNTSSQFTHSICPECGEILYGEGPDMNKSIN